MSGHVASNFVKVSGLTNAICLMFDPCAPQRLPTSDPPVGLNLLQLQTAHFLHYPFRSYFGANAEVCMVFVDSVCRACLDKATC